MASAASSFSPRALGLATSARSAQRSCGGALLTVFLLATYTRDWLHPSAFESEFVAQLGYAGVILALLFPLYFTVVYPHAPFSPDAKDALTAMLLAPGAVLFVVACQQLWPSPHQNAASAFVIILFSASMLWMLMGFRAADRVDLAYWLLSRLAFLLAILAVVATLFRISGLEFGLYGIYPGWQVRLVFLFAYAWYLSRWLLGRQDRGALVGLFAGSLEVWGTLHKPIVFSAVVCTVFILWSSRRFAPWRALAKILATTAVLLLGLWIADEWTGGSVSSHVQAVVYEKFFHQGTERSLGSGEDAFLRFTGGRLEIWDDAWERIQTSPWIGLGFDQTFPITIGENNGTVTIYVLSHNGYLDLLLSVGVLGILPLSVLVGWGMVRIHASSHTPMLVLVQTAICGYLVAIAAFNTGGTSRVFFGATLLPALLFGVGLRLGVDPIASSQRKRVS